MSIERDDVIYSDDMTTLIKYSETKEGAFVIPEEDRCIGSEAFCMCSKLTAIKFPTWLSKISTGAFGGCVNLEKIEFAEDSYLRTIEIEAFLGCKSLASIQLPDSVLVIEDAAFSGCEKMEKAVVPHHCKMHVDAFDSEFTEVIRYTKKSIKCHCS